MENEQIYTCVITSSQNEGPRLPWRALYDQYISRLRPNKKDAQCVLDYIRNHYPTEEFDSPTLKKVVYLNALGYRNYLPDDVEEKMNAQDVVALILKNEGTGKHLYDTQEEDYYAWEKKNQWISGAEKFVFEKIDILIGIEMHSGFMYIEGSRRLTEEIILYQGLNEKELTNVYLVATYVEIAQERNQLESILNNK